MKLADGYQEDYNYHDWSKFMVTNEKTAPKSRHFAVIMFDTKTEFNPPYDQHDSGSNSTYDIIHYFAFEKKEDLCAWILRAEKTKKKYFFYEVQTLGKVELKVNIGI
jgi:hypothetical protein